MNIPEYYEDVSIRLTEILDASGLGEDLRWWRINTWLQIEELDQLFFRMMTNTNWRMCCFGSQAEATTTHGLSSDVDRVCVNSFVTILGDLQFWELNPHTQQTFLMVTDDNTPPGYVKLQLVQRDAPILVHNYQDEIIRTDSKRRSVLGNSRYVELLDEYSYHHGPASSSHYMGVTMDVVMALQAHCWPAQASQWLSSRVRSYNWPSRRMIDIIQQTGVLLVPVGHKLSFEQQLEWRLSFSVGEKLLMMKMNSTQYKCYVMLKFIKNTFINVNGVDQVLTSYHCKTSMFYLMESTPNSLWVPANLLFCIDLCLRLLLSWVECHNCPNHFIPEENMFLGRNLGPVQGDIASILHELLREKGRYLTRILFDNIGENVARVCQSFPLKLDYHNTNIFLITFVHLENILSFVNLGLSTHDTININVPMLSHGLREEVVSIVRSLHCSAIGIYLTSQSLEQEIPNQDTLTMAQEFFFWGTNSDVASGQLKLAAFYLVRNDLNAMEEVLNHVDVKLAHIGFRAWGMIPSENTCSKIVHEKVSLAQLVRNYIALQVFYHASDVHSIPKPLITEIFRSTVSIPRADRTISHWIPIVGLEAKMYLYFLQYQCYHLQRRGVPSLVALGNMVLASQVDVHILDIVRTISVQTCIMARVTTNLNLVAYCLIQRVRPMYAFKVLCKSMKMKTHHNAAMWQIATFVLSITRLKVQQGH
ncbi:hypothetical protein ACJMK2_011949 [Sinanodonta woodiana]|uniref:Mab-21-like HhH/H2TH-like domain-containing protein n=1 Tax=Sinanodonta woodiana TaxID=1069815 RepID=A0ABD3V8Z7_SINWO